MPAWSGSTSPALKNMEHAEESNVVGVRFQEAGKIYYFTSAGYDNLEPGEYVVVETSRGLELARIVIAPDQVVNAELTEPLKPIIRPATDDDLARAEALKQRANQDVETAKGRSRAAGIPMKVISGSYNLDGSRLTLFFTSEGRIDFRDLVREVSHLVGAQVQLRQVGPRDQAKVVGGYGRCGRRLCCSSWLVNFPAISIKMAKEQDLPLNPSKISGQCGRLLCCLSYENEMYRQVKQALPRPGTFVSTPSGVARVHAVNVPREVVTLQMTETYQYVDVPVQDLGLDRGVVRILDKPPIPALAPEQAKPSVVAATPKPSNGAAPPQRAPVRSFQRPQRPEAPPASPAPAAASAGRPAEATSPSEPPAEARSESTPASRRRRRRRGGLGHGPRPPQG